MDIMVIITLVPAVAWFILLGAGLSEEHERNTQAKIAHELWLAEQRPRDAENLRRAQEAYDLKKAAEKDNAKT